MDAMLFPHCPMGICGNVALMCVFFSGFVAWYDYDLTQYQKERQETELEKYFEDRSTSQTHTDMAELIHKQKVVKEPETEWQQSVKKKKGEEYYSKLKEV